jgi:hypothetical protein
MVKSVRPYQEAALAHVLVKSFCGRVYHTVSYESKVILRTISPESMGGVMMRTISFLGTLAILANQRELPKHVHERGAIHTYWHI